MNREALPQVLQEILAEAQGDIGDSILGGLGRLRVSRDIADYQTLFATLQEALQQGAFSPLDVFVLDDYARDYQS